MQAADLTQLRLINQHLASPAFTTPADLVHYMGAIQSQDYSGAKWAIGQRLNGATDALIEKAFTDGDIIRTHLMRPTWHFVSPKDIRWLLLLTASRVQAIAGTQYRQFQLDQSVFTQCENVSSKSLQGGKQLTRNEIAEDLQQAGIATNDQRLIHIMMQMELIALVCSGGRQGKQFTYTLLDDRVPTTKTLDRNEALATLAERYFTAHGPATTQDFIWWSGLTVNDAKTGLEAIRHKLKSELIDGNTYWFADRDIDPTTKTLTAFLLPNYDEYIVSYKHRSAFIKEKDINKADPRGTIFNNTIIIIGRIAGIWKHSFKKDSVTLNIDPFSPLSKVSVAAVTSAAKRYAKFLELKDFILNIK